MKTKKRKCLRARAWILLSLFYGQYEKLLNKHMIEDQTFREVLAGVGPKT